MPKKRTMVDPTLPFTAIEISGKTYKMCLDLGALAAAETALRAQGHDVNLLLALPELTLASTLELFPASLHRFHPEIGYQEAVAMVTRVTIWPIASALADVWEMGKPEAAEKANADPPQPVL